MPDPTAQVREAVQTLLKSKKSLTEREVKKAVARTLKLKPDTIGAGIIRDVRKRLGIDRPSALAFARSLLAKDTALEARKVIEAVGERFGIRLGPPDVSRLRPTKAKVGRGARRKGGRPPKSAKPAEVMAPAPASEPAPVMAAPRRGRGRRGRRGRPGRPPKAAMAAPKLAVKGGKGAISVTFQGSGDPDSLAAFFMSLGQQGK